MTLRDRLISPGRRRVLVISAGEVVVERGSLDSIGMPDRLAVLAHYSEDRRVSRSFRVLVRQLSHLGYKAVIVSASLVEDELDWGGQLPPDAVVVRQPNVGYDFGSWAIGLDLVGEAAAAQSVILANDSMVGPFAKIDPLVEQFESSQADVWGMTDTQQLCHHLQSYFLGFQSGVLLDAPLAGFWRDVCIHPTKWDVIRHNEIAFSNLLYREGYVTTAAFRADSVVGSADNPVIAGWYRLLRAGFPFVKREVVRDPQVAPQGDRVADEVERLFGERLEDWL